MVAKEIIEHLLLLKYTTKKAAQIANKSFLLFICQTVIKKWAKDDAIYNYSQVKVGRVYIDFIWVTGTK